MDNIRETVFNDGTGKYQSIEYTIEATESAPWYYNNFSVTGYGATIEEAKAECLNQLKQFLSEMCDFVDSLEKKEII